MNFLANPLLTTNALAAPWFGSSNDSAALPGGEALASMMDPFGFGRAAVSYWRDSVERNILYWDVMRERGNQYLEHMEQT